MVRDTFVVVGGCDCSALAAAIGGVPVEMWQLPLPVRLGVRAGVTATAVAATIAVTVAATLAGGAIRVIQPVFRLIARSDRRR
jgi:hypothetical protein